ncbi:MAG: zinc ribbon domain-containing protein [Lentisphaerae bacterium]|nr:zinc ribbon domain-containing protein [Lentisphaerota bacterium]
MPTYDYECQKCGHSFEKFQSMTEERLKTCPKCKGAVKRLIGTGAGIIFKGSGFYETDYRSDSYQKGAQKASSSSAPAKSDEPKKGEESKKSDVPKKETKESSPKKEAPKKSTDNA